MQCPAVLYCSEPGWSPSVSLCVCSFGAASPLRSLCLVLLVRFSATTSRRSWFLTSRACAGSPYRLTHKPWRITSGAQSLRWGGAWGWGVVKREVGSPFWVFSDFVLLDSDRVALFAAPGARYWLLALGFISE